MFIPWLALCTIICFIVFSYIKHYTLKIRLISIAIVLMASLVLMLPIFPFSILTLLGLFLFERLWILLALVLIIELVVKRNNRVVLIIFAGISILIYFFVRTTI